MTDTITAPKKSQGSPFVTQEDDRRAMAYARLAFDVARAVSAYKSRRKEQIAEENQKEVQSPDSAS